MEAGGCVVRLVGLYHSLRGAHTFFLRAGQVDRWGGYTINLIHYEDAASLCLAVRAMSCLQLGVCQPEQALRVSYGCQPDGHRVHLRVVMRQLVASVLTAIAVHRKLPLARAPADLEGRWRGWSVLQGKSVCGHRRQSRDAAGAHKIVAPARCIVPPADRVFQSKCLRSDPPTRLSIESGHVASVAPVITPWHLQEMMDAVHASGAYEGRAALAGQPNASKGKLVCNAKTRQVGPHMSTDALPVAQR